jgi:hypothetical protein
MFQQGCLRDITRARHLIKAESASVFVLFTYPLFVLYSPQPFGSTRRGFDSQGTSHRPRVHYRLFNLNLSSCITSWNKPSIQPSNPTCQAALISTSRITTTTENTQRRVCPNSLEISWNLTFGAVTPSWRERSEKTILKIALWPRRPRALPGKTSDQRLPCWGTRIHNAAEPAHLHAPRGNQRWLNLIPHSRPREKNKKIILK